MSVINVVKKVFGFEGVGQSALKIVDKIAGTDWTPKEQAAFILDYSNATKHESKTRRVLAIGIFAEQFMLCTVWLTSRCIGAFIDSDQAVMLSVDIAEFMTSSTNVMLNGILAFYFLLNMKK